MGRTRFAVALSLCSLFVSSLFAAEAIHVRPLPARHHSERASVRANGATPSIEKIRDAVLRVAPRRAPKAALSATNVKPRLTGYAVGFRANGTPRQVRPIATVSTQSAVSVNAIDSARAFLRTNRDLFRLKDPDRELVMASETADDLGGTAIRFDQTWEGVPVWPAELIVHVNDGGNVQLVEGAYIPTPRRTLKQPLVSAAAAVKRAAVDGGTVSPPSLIVDAREGRRPRLAWKMTATKSLDEQWVVVVDAMTGAILQRYNDVKFASATGSGIDLSGTRRSLRLWQDGSTYYLLDAGKQMFDPTSTPPNPSTTRGGIFVSDFDHGEETFSLLRSTDPNTWNVRDSVSAAFWLSETYDYFLEHHGRNSIDGNKGTLAAAVRYKNSYLNAFWLDSQQLMVFGDAVTFAASLDVIAHEMTHGVTSHSANLVYEDQSGALNEAMSDIFGEMAEANFYGTNDWLMGSQIGGPFRNMANPGQFDDPGKMSEFVYTDSDNGGVHTNSGIINRAFYLLAAGLPGAIGRRDAERIFYRALTQHLTKDSQFLDARVAAITSANELFGANSTQSQKTAEAFDEVEIFAAGQTPEDPSIPVVNGPDGLLFHYYENALWHIGRREGDDPVQGIELVSDEVAVTRSAVTGDGSIAAFVDANQDVCLTLTSGTISPECAGFPAEGIFVSSVGMSPDASRFGVVLLGDDDLPVNAIIVVDIETEQSEVYDLSAPVFDGESLSAVRFADTMTFTADGNFLVYDALNVVVTDHGDYAAWSIYALDVTTGDVFTIVPVLEGLDIGSPALGKTSDDLLTFEAYEPETDEVTIYAADLGSGDASVIGTDRSIQTTPSFTGDDGAILYSITAASTDTGANIVRQPLASDHVTPVGARSLFMGSAAFPVAYRRGTYSGPTTTSGTLGFSATSYNVDEGSAATITVRRTGGNKGAVAISYSTTSGTAVSGSDFTPANGMLMWQDGEDDSKSFLLRAASDSLSEGNETLTLRLTGANLGSPSTATVTIVNQAPPASGKRRAARH